jgi:voltage-gated potassium channel
MTDRNDQANNPLGQNIKQSRLRFRAVGTVIWAAGLGPLTITFVVLFLASALIVDLFEPSVNGFGNASWFLFQVVTTIGLGDFTATSFVGRTAAVVLSIYSVFYLALITGAVVSFCSERMHARTQKSIAHFLDQLEHLPELSHEELVDLSERVKRFEAERRTSAADHSAQDR